MTHHHPQQAQPAYGPSPNPPKAWYHSGIVVGVSILFCAPVGLVLLWTDRASHIATKVIASLIFGGFWGLMMIGAVAGAASNDKESSAQAEAAPSNPTAIAKPPASEVPKETTMGILNSQNGIDVGCLHLNEAGILKIVKDNDDGKPERTAAQVKSEALAKSDEPVKGQPSEWVAVDSCPPNAIASCDAGDGSTLLAYHAEFGISIKESCEGTWRQSRSFDQAVRDIPIRVSAVDLHKAYDANEVRADNSYKGRRLLVTGKVASIDKDFLNNPILWLASSSMYQKVMARDLPSSPLADLNKGQTVTMLCVGGGMTVGSPVLSNCALR